MIKEPYIRIKTIDYSNLSDTVPDSLNTAMVINSDTGPTAVTKISTATQLIKYYSTKQQLSPLDDVTFKHAAKLLQFTPIYLTRAFDNSVLAGYTDGGELIYTDLSYNHLPFSLKVEIPQPVLSEEITLGQKIGPDIKINAKDYDKEIAQINSESGTKKYFKVSKGSSWTLVSEEEAVTDSSVSEVSNKYINSWDWIGFSSSSTGIEAKDYLMINGFSYYPENEDYLPSGGTTYPNSPVGLHINIETGDETNTYLDNNNGVLDFQLGLLDKLNSGEYGVTEAWGFSNGITITGNIKVLSDITESGVKLTTDNIKLFLDDSNGLKIYPNNIKFSPTGTERLTIKFDNDNTHKVYTLPYDPSYVYTEYGPDDSGSSDDIEYINVDTRDINTIYGLLVKLEEDGARFDNSQSISEKIYIKAADVESYTINDQTWVDENINQLKSSIESILPTQADLEDKAVISDFYIRIQDYVFYNKNITNRSIKNNPDIEQIKLSTADLTYKQLLTKLRKQVGDIFNTTNTPNGFTLFWRTMPDSTKFGSTIFKDGSVELPDEQQVRWNGKTLKGDIQTKKISELNKNSESPMVDIDSDGKILKIDVLNNPESGGFKLKDYNSAPVVEVSGGNGKAILSALYENGEISDIRVFNGGAEYTSSDYIYLKPAVQITNSSSIMDSAGFAVIARFPSKTPVLRFSYIRQDQESDEGDPELYTFTLFYKDVNIQESTISFIEDKVDGYGISSYFTKFNDQNDFVQIIPLNGEINFKKYEPENNFGNEIPVVEPEVDDYVSAAQRFKIKDGNYYDFVFDGGYVHPSYAKNLMEMCKGGSEDSLWAQAMLSCVNDKDWQDRINYRESTQINNCNAQMFGDWVVDNTIADFSIDISATAIAIEKIYANRDAGKEFACIFGPANGAMTYKPKYPILDKDIREKLLNKQINTLIWDNSLGLSYFNLDITMQLTDSSMSDCNNCRTVNCQSHIADNYMKWYWGRVNDEATRNEVIQGLIYRINQRCVNNQQYHVDDYIVVCNETNNPLSVVENRQLVVDIKDKFRPGIRYIHVFNKIYRLTQDFNSIG